MSRKGILSLKEEFSERFNNLVKEFRVNLPLNPQSYDQSLVIRDVLQNQNQTNGLIQQFQLENTQ